MFSAYTVGVKLSLINGLSGPLRLVTGQLLGAQRAVNGLYNAMGVLNQRFRSNRFMIGAGGAMTMGLGMGILSAVGDMAKWSKEYHARINQLRVAGMTEAEVAASVASAWKTSGEVMQKSVTENLHALLDLRTAHIDLADAQRFLPTLQKGAVVMEAAGYGTKTREQVFDAAKFLDMVGATKDPKMFEDWFGKMMQVSASTGNRITPETLRMTAKWARQAAPGYTAQFWFNDLVPFLVDTLNRTGGGSGQGGMGAPLAAFDKVFVQGIMKKETREKLQKYGLIEGEQKLLRQKDGSFKLSGGMWNRELAASNPALYMQELIAKLQNSMNSGKKFDPDSLRNVLTELFSGVPNTAKQALINFGTQAWKIERGTKMMNTTGSLSEMYAKAAQNPDLVEKALAVQWENLRTAVSKGAMPFLIWFLEKITNAVSSATQWVAAHPGAADLLIKFLIGLGGALTIFGGLALAGVGIMAIAGGLAAIGGALASPVFGTGLLIAAGITAVGTALYYLSSSLPSITSRLSSAWGGVKNWASSFVNYGANNRLPVNGGRPSNLLLPPTGAGSSVKPEVHVFLDGGRVSKAIAKTSARGMNIARTSGSRSNPRRGAANHVSARMH